MRPDALTARVCRVFLGRIAALGVALALLLSAPSGAQSPAPVASPSSAPTAAPSSAPAVAPSSAPTAAPSSAPEVAPSAAPSDATTAPAVPLSDVATQLEAANDMMRRIEADLDADALLTDVDVSLPETSEEVSSLIAEATDAVNQRPTLATIRRLDNALRKMRLPFNAWNQSLSARAAALEAELVEVEGLVALWRRTEAAAAAGHSPPEVSDRINALLHDLTLLEGRVKQRRSDALGLLARISDQLGRIGDAEDLMSKARTDSASLLLVRDTPVLWSAESFALRSAVQAMGLDIHAAARSALDYAHRSWLSMVVHLLLVLGLGISLRAARSTLPRWVDDEPACAPLTTVLGFPWASAYLATVPFQEVLYPLAPAMFDSAFYLLALLASVRLLTSILDDPLRRSVAPLSFLCCLVLMRYGFLRLDSVIRLVFLFEASAALLFALSVVRASQRAAREGDREGLGKRAVRALALTLCVTLLGVITLNVFGYSRLSRHVGVVTLATICSAVGAVGLTRIAEGLTVFLLGVSPLGDLRMLEQHRDAVRAVLRRGVRLLAFAVWVLLVLDALGIRRDAFSVASAVLGAALSIGSLRVSLGGVLGFVVAVWSAFALSRLITFLLDEEVFPRLSLARGLPYAIRTVFHYAVLFLGFFVATLTLGVDVSSLTFFVGAFSVGIGFGLQNIVNNFVSGLILLFERPANVGDLIQAGGHTGELRQIGLRACVLRASDGSEVVLPNGMLLSQQMVNWTLSDQRRLVEVEIPVPFDADPKQVFARMLDVARAHPNVLEEPAPQVLFVSLSGARMTYRLQVWTQQRLVGCALKSDLGLAMIAALRDAGIDLKG